MRILAGIIVFFGIVSSVFCADKIKKPALTDRDILNAAVVDSSLAHFNNDGDDIYRESDQLIRSGRDLAQALGGLQRLTANYDKKNKISFACVNLQLAKGYYLQGRYSLSLKYAFKAVSLSGDQADLRYKALLIAAINYRKLEQPEKEIRMYKMISSSDKADSMLKYLAESMIGTGVKK